MIKWAREGRTEGREESWQEEYWMLVYSCGPASSFQETVQDDTSDQETVMPRSLFICSCSLRSHSGSITYTFHPCCTLVKHMRG